MKLDSLIRFAFASKRRKLMTLVLLGTAGVSSLLGIGGSKAEPKSTPTSTTVQKPADPASPVTYANCGEVKAAGKAPIRKGDPGFGSHLDRDGDGIACTS